MKFEVLGRRYGVGIGSRYRGPGQIGHIDRQDREIELAPDSELPIGERLHTLTHELCHAALFVGRPPVPTTPDATEEFCDWFAEQFVNIHRQLTRQGGEAALVSLGSEGGPISVEEAILRGRALTAGEPYSANCPECMAPVASQSIIKSMPIPHPCGLPVIWKQFLCESCHHLVRWATAATEGGTPTEACVVQPTCVKNPRIVEAFCQAFPAQSGVMVQG